MLTWRTTRGPSVGRHARWQRSPRGPSRGRRLRGAALIEVLVSMLLSAVALLALASVNATALRLSKMSQHRANATLLALDLAERLQANPLASGAGHYGFAADWASQGAVPAPPAHCQAASSHCGSADIAALDMAQWRWHVRQLLPQGAVHVQNQPLGQPVTEHVDIWIAWQEPAAAGSSVGSPSQTPAPAEKCPDGLSVGSEGGVRCSHLRVHL